MPVQAHTRITFSGVYGSTTQPTEVWSFNVNTSAAFDRTVPAHQTVADACLTAYHTHMRPLYDTDVTLTRVRAAAIGIDGRVLKTPAGGFLQADKTGVSSGAQGAVAANRKPLQTALVVSLVSARAGASGKGRYFLPWPQPTVLDTEWRISTTAQTAILDASRLFLQAVAAAAGPVLVISYKDFASPVTGVRVGRVPDTMRSRRSHLIEGYAAATL